MNEHNMNPEQTRLQELFLKSERMRQDAHSASQQSVRPIKMQRSTEKPQVKKHDGNVITVRRNGKLTEAGSKWLKSLPEPVRRKLATEYQIQRNGEVIEVR